MTVDDILEKAFQSRAFSKMFFIVERKGKEWLFDCQSCGNCVLSHTGFICPMRCPKDLRNGPCGGAMDGMCEVDMSKRCVWDEIWESVNQLDRVTLLVSNYEGPPDWRLYGTSAWENMVAGHLESASIFETESKAVIATRQIWYRHCLEDYRFAMRAKLFMDPDRVRGTVYEVEVPRDEADREARQFGRDLLERDRQRFEKIKRTESVDLEYGGMVCYPLYEIQFQYGGKSFQSKFARPSCLMLTPTVFFNR